MADDELVDDSVPRVREPFQTEDGFRMVSDITGGLSHPKFGDVFNVGGDDRRSYTVRRTNGGSFRWVALDGFDLEEILTSSRTRAFRL